MNKKIEDIFNSSNIEDDMRKLSAIGDIYENGADFDMALSEEPAPENNEDDLENNNTEIVQDVEETESSEEDSEIVPTIIVEDSEKKPLDEEEIKEESVLLPEETTSEEITLNDDIVETSQEVIKDPEIIQEEDLEEPNEDNFSLEENEITEDHTTAIENPEKPENSIPSFEIVQELSEEQEKTELPKEDNYIDKMIDEKINEIENNQNVYGVGKVTKVMEFIIEVSGLENASFYEKVNIDNKAIGYVTKLETNKVIIAILEINEKINVGDLVYQTNEEFQGEYSTDSFGRIIDIFGNDKLTNKRFSNLEKIKIENDPIPLMDRTDVKRPLETGIVGIDLIYPIGKGQRQLIIGDKKTGKTQLLLDTICNQKNKNMICIFVAIGKTKKEVKEIYYELLKRDAASYTIIVTASYDDLPPVVYLTPYYALSIANKYMLEGKDVIVFIDDLKRHADAYREISLISGKSPGRDAYPADIFFAHSRLLERGCQYKNEGSVTILPVVETKGSDITDYISTNIISITDGQIVLSSKNFQKGIKPAIDYGLSVSRLGGAVQEQDIKNLGVVVRYKLLSYLETSEVYELANVDEMTKELQEKLFEGKKILDNLKQYKYSPLTKEQMLEKFKFIGDNNNV